MTTLTPQSRNSVTLTAQSGNAVTATSQSRSLGTGTLATAGLYRGFGAFNYSGGEILVAGSLPVFTSQSRN